MHSAPFEQAKFQFPFVRMKNGFEEIKIHSHENSETLTYFIVATINTLLNM